MSIESIIKDFNVKTKIYLEHLEHLPSSFLHTHLQSLYQSCYKDPDKFIFLNFTPVSKTLLKHVVQTLQYIDISPWFVLVISNQIDTINYFSDLNEPINCIELSGESTDPLIKCAQPWFDTDQKLCGHVWAGLHFNTNGEARPCCDYSEVIINDDGDPFNIKQHSITEIVNSKYMQSLRQDFRANGMPDACRSCQQRENRNQFSRRQIAPYKLKNIYGEIIWEDDVVTPRWIGGNLGNLCNLKCRICNPNWSSSIAVEKLTQIDPDQRKNSRYYQILQDCNWSHHGDKFWQELKSLSAHIRNFEFLGGEPLLYKENLNFIRYLVDSGLSKNCMFEFTTNGTQYPETLDQIDQFQRFTFTVSIDNLDKKFEFERSGAKWDQVAANLSRMISQAKLNDRIKVGANIIVNIQNVLYLPELLKYLIAQGINFYTLHILSDPTWLSIYNLTERARELTLDKLSSADVGEEIQRDLDIIMNLLKKIQPSDGKEFCSNMKLLDNTRQENFAETHYEIAQAMGYML